VEQPDQRDVSTLNDIELVRMLTVDAKEYTAELLAAAEAEAVRRGVPIDEAFIPSFGDESTATGQAKRFEVVGKTVKCPHCGGVLFETRDFVMNTIGPFVSRVEWLNGTATALICGSCGRIQLFAMAPEAAGDGS
jgi:hypothetical protein